MASTIRGSDNFDTADNATQTELDNKVVGKVLQVVNVSNTTEQILATTSWTDTNLSLTITPSSTSSKIRLEFNIPFIYLLVSELVNGASIIAYDVPDTL